MENITFPRKAREKLIKEISHPEIIVLTGMRQVGKTTLLNDIYNETRSSNKIFIDLENPLNQKLFETDNYDDILRELELKGLLRSEKMFVFIDEIQVVPNITRIIKYIYDHYKIKFFLTGSSSFYLKNLFPESLAGRKFTYELFPLDFEEFLIFKNQKKTFFPTFEEKAKNKSATNHSRYSSLYMEFLEFGGFPGVVKQPDRDRKIRALEDIFRSYFEKDVRVLSDFKNLSKFRNTALLLSARCGSKLDISKISSEADITRDTLYAYIDFLQSTYFISLVPPYSKNIDGTVRGAKKVYLCDTGLLNILSRVNPGALLENSIYQSLRGKGEVCYFQKYKGPEIDFILDNKIAFEVKQSAHVQDVNRLHGLCRDLGIKERYVISNKYLPGDTVISAPDL
ncbi:MAG: ATP-binding protein [Bacteroidetes bacterium]|nr:ATP-binding protein [Bacteroidota bacterium]